MRTILSYDPEAQTKTLPTGEEMHEFISSLFPICRSITGRGTLETLKIIKEYIPIIINKIPTGTRVFDWNIPKEWNIRDAYVKDTSGNRVIDFQKSNLHVVNYSIPIHRMVSRKELFDHLHTLPEYPDWVPYRTSYYNEDWGFCVSDTQSKNLTDETYEVCIDTTLTPGHLVYGEMLIKGKTADEVLISTHICHPSLCNDNLSGIAVATFLAKSLMKRKTRYSYRFVFIPGTIGAITWLSLNEFNVSRIKHGLVASLLGSEGAFVYKRSRRGDAEIDQVVEYILKQHARENEVRDFFPYGYDERQYCSPGFNLPVGSLTRTPFGEFPEYHTSADNLEFVKAESLRESLQIYTRVVDVLEANVRYINMLPKCEPHLSKYHLYENIGGFNTAREMQLALLWVLNLSDGKYTLLDITKKAALNFDLIRQAADKLRKSQLIDISTVNGAPLGSK